MTDFFLLWIIQTQLIYIIVRCYHVKQTIRMLQSAYFSNIQPIQLTNRVNIKKVIKVSKFIQC